MYNTFYRTEIEDQDHRRFIDTFMGPNAIAASMMSVIRNYFYTLACRVSMDLLIPITRLATIKTFQTMTFDVLRKATFAEGFLHTRFFRQIFETGLDFFTWAVFWFMTKYKNKYVNSPPTTTATPTTTEATTMEEATTIIVNDTSPEYFYITTTPLTQNSKYAPFIDNNFESSASSTLNYIDLLKSTSEKYIYINPEPYTEPKILEEKNLVQSTTTYYKDENPSGTQNVHTFPTNQKPGQSSNYAYFHTHSQPDFVTKPQHKEAVKTAYKETTISEPPETTPTPTTTTIYSTTFKTYHKPTQSSIYAYFHTHSQPVHDSNPEQIDYTYPVGQDPPSFSSESTETSTLQIPTTSFTSDIQYLGGLDDISGPASIKRVDTIFDRATLSDLKDAIERLDLILKEKNRQKDGNKTVEKGNYPNYNQPRQAFPVNPVAHKRVVSKNHRQLSTYKNAHQNPHGILKAKKHGPWLRKNISHGLGPNVRENRIKTRKQF